MLLTSDMEVLVLDFKATSGESYDITIVVFKKVQ